MALTINLVYAQETVNDELIVKVQSNTSTAKVVLFGRRNNATVSSFSDLDFKNKDDDSGGLEYVGSRISSWNNGSGQGDLRFYVNNGSGLFESIRFLKSGSVGIGTTTTGSHKLAVGGSIGAREIKVEANGWSDFVFENDYELRTLEEVEEHIAENGHLPEIPSEAEVTENGINLGEMNAKLLQKIEELTLYMIGMNKRVNQLEQENSELKEKVKSIENE